MRPSVYFAAVLVCVALAPVANGQNASGQGASGQGGPLAQAQALLAAGDSSSAERVASRAVRRGETPNAAALRRIQLGLFLEGYGLTGPRWMRHEQIADAAQALLRLAPADTLALRVLTDDAVWTVLTWRDRVEPGAVRNEYGDFVSPAEVRARMARSRFDIDDRTAMSPWLDRSSRARRAGEDASGYLNRWLAVDPTAVRAYEAAMTLAVVGEAWDGALALARRFQAASDDPRADLYAGLALYRTSDPAGAEAAFDRALGQLAPSARARYENLRILLPTGQRDAFDATPDAVADSFWTAADPRLLTEANERLAEHRARVVEADLLFGWTGDDLFTLSRPRGAEADQGRLWIRYGRPRRSLRFVLDRGAVQSYAGDNPDTPFGIWDYGDFQFVFDDPERDGQFRRYSPPASAFAGPSASSAQNDDFVMQDERMQRDDPQRTQVVGTLDVPLLVSRFRSAGGGTDVVAAWGVPLDAVRVPVRTGAFALSAGAIVDRDVEERRQLAAGRRVGGLWAEAGQVTLPSSGEVRVEVDDGRAFGGASEAVAPLATASGLSVSDLLLALAVDEDGSGAVVRDGIGITPAPRATLPTTDPLYVYLEAYGLGLDVGQTRYTVEARLRPEARRGGVLGLLFGRGQGPGVSVRTEASGTRSDEAVTFFIDVRDQRPGRYTLRVEVRDETTGETASAERAVVLE
ncbi:MAG: GWxTD domain-containing protein [Bacteroidota bacterium]